MTNTEKYRRMADLPAAEMDDELAVMNMATGSYLTLNRTAADVWKLLDIPRSLAELTDAMTTKYAIARPECEAQLRVLLARLQQLGVVGPGNA